MEILISLLILAFGITAVFGLYGTATYSNRRSINEAILVRMASSIIADLKTGQHPAALDLQNRTDQNYPGYPGLYTYDLTFSQVPTDIEPKAYIVDLTIKKSGIVAETFRTFLFFPASPN
jgi:hypothetical protein